MASRIGTGVALTLPTTLAWVSVPVEASRVRIATALESALPVYTSEPSPRIARPSTAPSAIPGAQLNKKSSAK